MQPGVFQVELLQQAERRKAAEILQLVAGQIQLPQLRQIAERRRRADLVAGGVQLLQRLHRHQRAQIPDPVAGDVQLGQIRQIHQGRQIGDLIVAQVQHRQLPTGGQRADIVQLASAQIQLGHFLAEGHAAQGQLPGLRHRGLAVDGAVRQRLRQGLQLRLGDLDVPDAQHLQLLQRVQRREIRDRIAVQIQGPQPRQRCEGADLGNVVAAQIQHGQTAETGEGGDVAEAVLREAQAAQGVQHRHAAQVLLAERRAPDDEGAGVALHLHAGDRDLAGLAHQLLLALQQVDAHADLLVAEVHRAQQLQRLVVIAQRFIAVHHLQPDLPAVMGRRRLAQMAEGVVILPGVIALLRLAQVLPVALLRRRSLQGERHDQQQHDHQRQRDQHRLLPQAGGAAFQQLPFHLVDRHLRRSLPFLFDGRVLPGRVFHARQFFSAGRLLRRSMPPGRGFILHGGCFSLCGLAGRVRAGCDTSCPSGHTFLLYLVL